MSATPCTYSLGSGSGSIGSGGRRRQRDADHAADCYWNASSNANWITLNAGSTSGLGPATLQFTVAANASTSSRDGTLTITGQTYTVTQAGRLQLHGVAGERVVWEHWRVGQHHSDRPGRCAWTAAVTTNPTSMLSITSGSSGSGNGTVNYSVSSEALRRSVPERLLPRGQTVTIYQA